MLKEEKIRNLIEEELLGLEYFADMEKTNIYKNDIVEFDRRVQRMSAFYEVLEEVPSEDVLLIITAAKEKLQQ